MIVADKKPIEEIIAEIKGNENVLVLGCNECVTVCEAGGKKEVGVLASALRMYFLNQGQEVKIEFLRIFERAKRFFKRIPRKAYQHVPENLHVVFFHEFNTLLYLFYRFAFVYL